MPGLPTGSTMMRPSGSRQQGGGPFEDEVEVAGSGRRSARALHQLQGMFVIVFAAHALVFARMGRDHEVVVAAQIGLQFGKFRA